MFFIHFFCAIFSKTQAQNISRGLWHSSAPIFHSLVQNGGNSGQSLIFIKFSPILDSLGIKMRWNEILENDDDFWNLSIVLLNGRFSNDFILIHIFDYLNKNDKKWQNLKGILYSFSNWEIGQSDKCLFDMEIAEDSVEFVFWSKCENGIQNFKYVISKIEILAKKELI